MPVMANRRIQTEEVMKHLGRVSEGRIDPLRIPVYIYGARSAYSMRVAAREGNPTGGILNSNQAGGQNHERKQS